MHNFEKRNRPLPPQSKKIFINDPRFVVPLCGINRDMREVVDKANMTPDSFATDNSKTELDNTFFQVTLIIAGANKLLDISYHGV